MVNINFRKKETFETPDGEVWEINPLKRRHLKKLNRFIKLNTKLQELQKNGDVEAANKIIFGEEEDNDEEETLLKIADDIIDLSIKNVKTGKELPEDYRLEISTTIELCTAVIQTSTGKVKQSQNGDDTPLPTKKENDTKEQGITT
jgi:hypothetical protein